MLKNKFLRITSITILLLLIPLIAMQLTEEVNWGLMDFVIGGVLIFGIVGLLDWLIMGKLPKSKYAIGLAITLLFLFLLLWAELAVGIFGTPFGGN